MAATDAPKIVESIRIGFKHGVQSIVMGTRSHPNGDEYYLVAFAQGRSAMRFASSAWVLARMLAPFVFIGVIFAFLIWYFAP